MNKKKRLLCYLAGVVCVVVMTVGLQAEPATPNSESTQDFWNQVTIPIIAATENVKVIMEPNPVVPGERLLMSLDAKVKINKASVVLSNKLTIPFEKINDYLWVAKLVVPLDTTYGTHRVKIYFETEESPLTYLLITRMDIHSAEIAKSETGVDFFQKQEEKIHELENKVLLFRQQLQTVDADEYQGKIEQLEHLVNALEDQTQVYQSQMKTLESEKEQLQHASKFNYYYQNAQSKNSNFLKKKFNFRPVQMKPL